MELNIAGRVAVVTGGSKGIGRAVVEALAKEGAKVVVCARGLTDLVQTEQQIRRAGGEVTGLICDTYDIKSISDVIEKTVNLYGKLDILVNNIGGAPKFADFDDLSDEDWVSTFNLNVMSIVRFVRVAVPWLVKSKAGRIINISSISGIEPGYYNPHYTTTKAAVINLTKYLANYYAKYNLLVNAVCPGPVYSDSWEKNLQRLSMVRGLSIDEVRKSIDAEERAKIPLGRVGDVDDVAGLVAFLVSDQGKWITGACFPIDGGKLRSI